MAGTSIRRLALLAFPFLLRLGSADQQCYFPDGTTSNDVPCTSDDSYQTFCCAPGATCVLDPGPLCQTSSGYERGTCTVQDWSSGACPLFCLADNNDNAVDRCAAKASNGNFCCGYDADADLCSCDLNNNTFPLYAYSSIKVAQTASSTSSSSSSSSSATSSLSSAVTTGVTSNPTGSPTTASGSVASGATTGTAAPSPTSTSNDNGMTTGAKIGVGVAVPLGVIAIGLLAFLAWRMRKKSKGADVAAHPAELPPQGNRGYYDPPPHEVKYAHQGQAGYGGYSPNQQAPSELYTPPVAQQHQAYEMPATQK